MTEFFFFAGIPRIIHSDCSVLPQFLRYVTSVLVGFNPDPFKSDFL